MQIDTNQAIHTFYQQILQTIAEHPDPRHSASSILQSALPLTGSTGACFVVYGESELRISAGDIQQPQHDVEIALQQLSPGTHIDPQLPDGSPIFAEHTLVMPLHDENTAMGVLCFASPDSLGHLEDQQPLIFDPLCDTFTILARNAQNLELRQQAEQLTVSILNSITDPLIVVNDDKAVLFLNPAAENLFDTSMELARGQWLHEIVQSDELMQFSEDTNNNLNEWMSDDQQTFVPHAEPVLDPDGNVEGWVLALRDITHYKKLNRNQNEFTRIVSHDLRSPLTSMQGFANMLELQLVGELNEKQAHFVDKILSGVSQMTALVDNIQDAGRYDPETGFYEISRSQCDINDIVNRINENYLVPAEKQELELTVHVTDAVPIINADFNMLERALTNLVDNAIKYTPNGGKVDVRAETRDDQIIISVSDTGYGISPENQKQLFERHVRIPRQEHKRIKGSGLGLFIVKSVAQRHGGDAWVESVENEGTTFFISIPLEGQNLIGSENNQ